MQSNHKEIYKLTSERTGKPEQLYKEVGNFVFANLYSKLRRPNKLIIKLKGVGTWYLRKKRMDEIVTKYPPAVKTEFRHELELFKHENKVEIYEIFLERLKDYDIYLKERAEIRKQRYASQSILTSKEEGQ